MGLGLDGDASLASTESSYTLELMSSRYLKKNAASLVGELPFNDANNWKSKMNSGANLVSRVGQNAGLDRNMHGGRESTARRSSPAIDTVRPPRKDVDPEKEMRAELVTLRTRQEHCRNFIGHCGNSSANGPWSKRTGRCVKFACYLLLNILMASSGAGILMTFCPTA